MEEFEAEKQWIAKFNQDKQMEKLKQYEEWDYKVRE